MRRQTLVLWTALSVMLGILSLGVPRHAGPDEPAHAIRAAGLARGQMLGDEVAGDDARRVFDVPLWVVQPSPNCYATRSDDKAGCSSVVVTEGSGDLVSSAATYPPPAHLIPAIGTLVPLGSRALYISRLLGVTFASGMLAVALGRVARLGTHALFVTLLALTPAALFTTVVINPSGFAVVGTVALVVGLRDLADGDRTASWLAIVGFCSVVLSRPDGWFWALAVVVLLGVAWDRGPLIRIYRCLQPVPRAVGAVTWGAAVLWSVVVRPRLIPVPTEARGWELLQVVLSRTAVHVDEAIGLFGWYDTAIPSLASSSWWLLLGVAGTMTWRRGAHRALAAAVIGLSGFVIAGWAADLISARSVGLVWQGRYGLPLFIVGVMVLAFGDLGRRETAGLGGRTPVLWMVTGVWVASFWQALRRWSVGTNGSPFPWDWERGASAIHPLIVLVVFALAAGAMVRSLGLPSIAPTEASAKKS